MASRKKATKSPEQLERIRRWLTPDRPGPNGEEPERQELLDSDVAWLVGQYCGQEYRIKRAEETEARMAAFRKALDDAGFS